MKKAMTFLLSILLLGLVLNGCQQDNPVQSPVKEEVEAAPQYRIIESTITNLEKPFYAAGWLTWYGGQVVLGDQRTGYSGLIFPVGAVQTPVYISFYWESTGLLMGGAEFAPHGTQFYRPVFIQLSYKDANLNGIAEEDLKLLYFNDETGSWELISDNVHPDDDVITGYIWHFSRYAIGTE